MRITTTKSRILALTGLMALTILAAPLVAQAKLLIMPTYIVFKDRERTQDITIMNTSDKPGTYRVGWLNYQQNERGTYDRQDGPISPHFDPETMIVFSPRQVTLPPRAKQRIRLSLRRPPDLPDGEYRAHLKLQSIGRPDAVSRTNVEGGVATEVRANVGFAVPVIIRQGEHEAQIKIDSPQFLPAPNEKDNRPRLKVTLHRSGAHGTMGRLRAYWTPPGQEERRIGQLNNVNAFPEIDHRTAFIPLQENNVNAGTLRIVYEGTGVDRGKTFDELMLPIGN